LTGTGRAERPYAVPPLAAAEISALIDGELRQVERMFRANLSAPLGIIDEIGEFVADGGGKRVRPTLHLLCARLCDYGGPNSILLATVLEFIHSATLIHDDIIDEAKTRRGRPSVNCQWGNNTTVLFGDYLFAKAMQMALQAESLQVMDKLADVTLRMTEGEMLQTRYVGRLDLSVEEYLDLIERKTAALFGCCCELAGMLAGVDLERQKALRRYGLNLGMAFQLVDDLLDFTGDAQTLGKPAASDLREGKATLAVLDLLGNGDDGQARELAVCVMKDAARPDTPEILRLTEILRESGAIERTQHRARIFADRAVGELKRFADNPANRALRTLPDFLLSRDR
jgi:octaprenyl-diphosphate synthase